MSADNAAEVLMAIAENAKPLGSLEAGSGFEDLEPLRDALKGVRVVGLGEATHGTKEFFQLKHRLLEFLVEQMGFRVFLIEAGYIPCLDIHDYIMFGRGDPAEALAGQGYFCWDTEEVSNLIRWMRRYNLQCSHGEECGFLGYDIKPVRAGMDYVLSYLRKTLPDFVDMLELAFSSMLKLDLYSTDLGDESRETALKDLYAVLGALELRKDLCVRLSSSREYKIAVGYLANVVQLLDSFVFDEGETGRLSLSIARRDLHMAENIEKIIGDYPDDSRFVVWAHNAHIEVNRKWGGKDRTLNMGAMLRERYGDDYYSLGFTFGRGSFQARESLKGERLPGELKEFTIQGQSKESIEWYMSEAKAGNYYCDFRHVGGETTLHRWLQEPRKMTRIGAAFSSDWLPDDYSYPTELGEYYDGIVHIEETTRAIPNPSGMRKKGQSGALI